MNAPILGSMRAEGVLESTYSWGLHNEPLLVPADPRRTWRNRSGIRLALVFLAMVGAIGTFSDGVIGTWDTVRTTSADAVARSDS